VGDAERILQRLQNIAAVLEARVVDLLGQTLGEHLVHVDGAEALQVGGATRQPALGGHLGTALGITRLVLDDLPAFRDQDRRLDVLV
jgi:hypothetical protein